MSKLFLRWQADLETPTLLISGRLALNSLPATLPALSERKTTYTNIILDCSGLEELDTSGAYTLLLMLTERGFDTRQILLQNVSDDYSNIFELVLKRGEIADSEEKENTRLLSDITEKIGRYLYKCARIYNDCISLLGQMLSAFLRYLLNPAGFRPREVFTQLQQTGLGAVPVVCLLNFLIGMVMAYLLAMQAEKFGASIFVVDGVALAMCREMSPILVAVILAGRSGSAFTAQLGAMNLTEEIDALKSLGLKPFDVLIFPRIFSLLISLPLLVFVGDIVGMYGGMLITEYYLGLSSSTFIQRLEQVLSLRHVAAGLIKAPFFALAIGLIACYVGLNTPKNARSVGLSTTKTVVLSIVAVIIINAAFAILFAEIGF